MQFSFTGDSDDADVINTNNMRCITVMPSKYTAAYSLFMQKIRLVLFKTFLSKNLSKD